MSLHAVTVKASFTACSHTMGEAREKLAAQLRYLAETIEDDHDTFAESGNIGISDYGSWEINDPWESNPPPKPLQETKR